MANVLDVARYFLSLCDPEAGDTISNLKLQKLLYYAQGFNLALFHKPLFDDAVEAWTHGPVVRRAYNAFSNHGASAIPAGEGFNPEVLSEDVRELLDEVYSVYGQYSAWKLRNMTHEEPPWIDAREAGTDVTHESMLDFFSTLIDKAGMKEDVYTLKEGDVVFQWPDRLSPESYEDLKDWAELILRKVKRHVVADEDAHEPDPKTLGDEL